MADITGTISYRHTIPKCDFCNNGTLAEYDAKTLMGPWANMCKLHFAQYSNDSMGRLGIGRGQRIVQSDKGD